MGKFATMKKTDVVYKSLIEKVDWNKVKEAAEGEKSTNLAKAQKLNREAVAEKKKKAYAKVGLVKRDLVFRIKYDKKIMGSSHYGDGDILLVKDFTQLKKMRELYASYVEKAHTRIEGEFIANSLVFNIKFTRDLGKKVQDALKKGDVRMAMTQVQPARVKVMRLKEWATKAELKKVAAKIAKEEKVQPKDMDLGRFDIGKYKKQVVDLDKAVTKLERLVDGKAEELERAKIEEASSEDPGYRKALKECIAGYDEILEAVKGSLTKGRDLSIRGKNLLLKAKGSTEEQAVDLVKQATVLVEEIDKEEKSLKESVALSRSSNSPLQKKKETAKITKEDSNRFLTPIMTQTYAFNTRAVALFGDGKAAVKKMAKGLQQLHGIPEAGVLFKKL